MRYLPHLALYAGIAMVVHSLFGCGGVQRLDTRSVPSFTLTEMRAPEGPTRVRAALGRGGFVVRVKKGEALPVRLSTRLGVARLKSQRNELVFERDVYLFVAKRRVHLSPDGKRWVALGSWRTMKRLFGIRRGTVQVGFGVSQKDGPLVTVGVDALP